MVAKVSIILELIDKASGNAKKATSSIGGLTKATDKSTASTASFSEKLKGLATKGAAVGAVLVATGLAIKKAFDFAEQGAIITQTAESFDLLIGKVGAAPDLLDQLSTASQGTISDFQLMTSTATLLAGTSGDLATSLAAATPQLLNIAKAANKLNPALGDTDFLYKSIAQGIKRSSPLILDNLGIVVKVGQANEEFAKSAGKLVSELSAEEKQMALLNAVLAQGDTLIDQVGGSTESAADAFAVLRANAANAFDTIRQGISTAVLPAVEAINASVSVTEALNDALEEGAIPLEQYNRITAQLGFNTISTQQAQDELNRAYEEAIPRLAEADALSERMARTQEGLAAAIDASAAATNNYTGATDSLAAALLPTSESLLDGTLAASNLSAAYKNLGLSAAQAAQQVILNQIANDDLTAAEIELRLAKLDELKATQKLTEATADGTIGEDAFFAILSDGIVTMDEVNAALGIEADQIGAAEEAALAGAQSQTLYNEKITATEKKARAAAAALAATKKAVGALDGSEATITINVEGDTIPGAGGGGGSVGNTALETGKPAKEAAGGPVFAGTPVLVGERGPELFLPPSGGKIASNAQSNAIIRGGNGADGGTSPSDTMMIMAALQALPDQIAQSLQAVIA